MATECPTCGVKFKSIGHHWTHPSSECNYPKLTEHQKEVITGLLMGDGYIDRFSSKNPRLSSKMVTPNYLRRIDDIFGVLGTGVSLYNTAEESAERMRKRGFRPEAKAENYSDVYLWRSRRHPEIKSFAEWYSSGEKVWPEHIELTPTTLKHWYVGDGHYKNDSTHNHIVINISNEINNKNKISRLFEKSGLPSPNNYSEYTNKNNIFCNAEFNVSESEELWEYMGSPPPGFGYKWPKEFK